MWCYGILVYMLRVVGLNLYVSYVPTNSICVYANMLDREPTSFGNGNLCAVSFVVEMIVLSRSLLSEYFAAAALLISIKDTRDFSIY